MRKQLSPSEQGLKIFRQHGFEETTMSGNQYVGNCIFCGRSGHFYVNAEKKLWDCKVCGRAGGYEKFLHELVDVSNANLSTTAANILSENRGISADILRSFHVGYNTVNDSYLIPVYNSDKSKLCDVRKYKIGEQLFSSVGASVGLFNAHAMADEGTVWLCEGEWDAMAAAQYLQCAVVGVPGAGTFKAEWAGLFSDKKVYVVYDNDKAGREGMIKVYNSLVSTARELQFVHWPETYPEGFDVRDYQKEHKTVKGIKQLFSPLPPGVDTGETVTAGAESHAGHTAEEVYEGYRKFLHIDDTTVLDVVYGTMISNRIDGDPLWMFVIAPPGGYKTELLMSLSDAPKVATTTSLTPHSLVSGCSLSGGADPSLIPKLNGKVLIVKDFTTILNMNQAIRDEIFGILRDSYDGKTEKHFGNGVFRSYESKFGILAGVTPAVELYLDGNAAMGERFLGYKTPIAASLEDRRTILKRAVGNVGNEKQLRVDLKLLAKETLLYKYEQIPTVPGVIEDKVIDLAQWIAMMRGTVNRDRYTKEITHKPFAELGTRLAKQFFKLLIGITMFRRKAEAGESEFAIVKHIGLGTLPGRSEEFARIAYKHFADRTFDAETISDRVGLPRVTCQRIIDDIAMLGIFERKKINGLRIEYTYKKSILGLMERIGVYASR